MTLISLLIALVTYGEPTPGNYYMHDVVPPKGAFWEEFMADSNVRPGIHQRLDFFLPNTFFAF